jgi:hypothetical protein
MSLVRNLLRMWCWVSFGKQAQHSLVATQVVVCGLFNDAVSSSDYIQFNDRIVKRLKTSAKYMSTWLSNQYLCCFPTEGISFVLISE